jgi:hypothetical protein
MSGLKAGPPTTREIFKLGQYQIDRFVAAAPDPVLEFAASAYSGGLQAQPHPWRHRMAMEIDLIPKGTLVQENGHAEAVDIRSSATRTFYCVLQINEQIEQESVDVSIWGSADGENWGTHPVLKLPQQFYKGETRAVLDLTLVPEVNFIRAAWDLNRWGRVAPLPMFVLGVHLQEIPGMPARVPQPQASAAS